MQETDLLPRGETRNGRLDFRIPSHDLSARHHLVRAEGLGVGPGRQTGRQRVAGLSGGEAGEEEKKTPGSSWCGRRPWRGHSVGAIFILSWTNKLHVNDLQSSGSVPCS